MRFGVKADLLLEGNVNSCVPISDATMLDGAAVVQMLNPKGSRTFQEYGDGVFGPYIYTQLEKNNRVDIVWDVYRPKKKQREGHQKKGSSRYINALFAFLSHVTICLPVGEGKFFYATDGTRVLCSPADSCLSHLAPCSQEEADTRLRLHVADAVQKGCRKVTIHTVDTDVVVLAVASFSKISLDELWVAFGVKSNF